MEEHRLDKKQRYSHPGHFIQIENTLSVFKIRLIVHAP